MACMAFSLLAAMPARATHTAGMELTYRSLGGLTVELTLTYYRDCAGIAEPTIAMVAVTSANAGYAAVVAAAKDAGPGTGITAPCPSAPTTCNGGSSTGILRFVYRGTVTLPSPQTDWTFAYSVCCRNCAITTLQNPCNEKLYVEALLDNLNAPGNSSPAFSNIPLVFACLGQPFHYNAGMTDPDGDSLVCSLVPPLSAAGTPVPFLSPATVANPIAGAASFNLDPVTGDLSFLPMLAEIAVLAVEVQEHRNGIVVGRVVRDIQVYAGPCGNNLPSLTGMDGTSAYSRTVHPGDTVCVTVYSDDADSLQNLSLQCSNGIANAVYTASAGPRPSMQVCWIPDSSDAGANPHVFVLTVADDACPVNGMRSYGYRFTVAPAGASTGTDGSEADMAAAGLRLYPNPAPGHAVASVVPPASGMLNAWLTDAAGRTVRMLPQERGIRNREMEIPIPLQDLPAGIYFIRVIFSDGSGRAARIVSAQ